AAWAGLVLSECALPRRTRLIQLAWSPWPRHLASLHEDGTIVVWDAETEVPARIIQAPARQLDLLQQSDLMRSAVRRIDSMRAMTPRISGIAFSGNGKWLAAGGGGRVHFFDTRGNHARELRLEEEWCLRIQCAPDAALPVAHALAQHKESTWVYLTSGGTEIACLARTDLGGASVLLRKLPETPRVNGITAHCLLHTYYGREFSTINKIGLLTAEQADQLRPDSAALASSAQLTPADRRMLDALSLDGRATYQDLAQTAGWSQSTVQRRMTELRQHGLPYFHVYVAPP